MKHLFILLTFLLVMTSQAHPQSGWIWQNPSVTGNTLFSIDMVNSTTGFAAGNAGTVIKTTNNGTTWTTLLTDITTHLYSVSFVDVNVGYACGANGVIVKTLDGGNSWETLNSGFSSQLMGIQFLNTNTGYAVATFDTVLKTTNAGDTWTKTATGGIGGFFGMHFLNVNTGHIVGNGGKMQRTTDGGATWVEKSVMDLNPLFSVFFLNGDTGFAASSDLRKTTNGGNSWQLISLPDYIWLQDMIFTDNNTGYIVAGENFGSKIFKTTDAGLTWVTQLSNFENELYGVTFTSNTNGFAVGELGTSYKTTNGGDNWISMRNSAADVTLETIHFPTIDTGYASGFGQIVKTTNAGITWVNTNFSFPGVQTNGVYFINGNTGFVGSQNNNIYRTTDGAATWTAINPTEFSLYNCFYFTNETTGYAAGAQGKIIKTTDAGLTWSAQSSGTTWDLRDMKFYNDTLGYIAGIQGTLLRTTNAGVNWVQMSQPLGNSNFSGIDFYGDTGVAVTENFAEIIRSTDGGTTWAPVTSPVGTGLTGIKMISNTTGYISGWVGVILKTTDAGASWVRIPSSTNLNLEDIFFTTENSAYVTGQSGTILHADFGGTMLRGTVKYEDNGQSVTSGHVLAFKLDRITNEVIVTGAGIIQPNGEYSIANLPGDTVMIVAYPNSEMDYVPTYYPSTVDWTQALRVLPSGNLSNVDIEVFRIEGDTPQGSVSGGVFQNQRLDSNQLDYAIVYAKLNGIYKNYSVSISNGTYDVSGLPYGNYEFFVSRPGFENETFQINFNAGTGIDSVNIFMDILTTGVTNGNNETPDVYELKQNYPNPFNPTTKIGYSIPTKQLVKLSVYDILGRKVASLVNTVQNAGAYTVNFNGANLSSGIYFYMIEAGDFRISKKMLLVK